MKKIIKFSWVALFAIASMNAQQEKGIVGSSNWLNNWTEFKPKEASYNETTQILYGKITTNTTLYKKNSYLLQGPVYVTNNAVLTIEAGTVIKGDADTNGALVITKGSQLIAKGSETDPIVFTSNRPVKKPGDWSGIVVLGDAPINRFGGVASLNYELDQANTMYGGSNPASTSGVLEFLRIEFAGKKIKGFKDYNGLSLAGVGNKTSINNIMVSFSASNSVEVLGGDMTMKNMVSLRASGDDFKFTQGAQCKIDNALAVRHSYYSGSCRSRALNISLYEKKEEADMTKKLTSVIANNCTIVNTTDNLAQDLASGLVKEAVYVAANTTLELKNAVISGFSPAVILDNEINLDTPTLAKIKIQGVLFNNCKGNIYVQNSTNNDELEQYYGDPSFFNLYENTTNSEMFIDSSNAKSTPDFRIKLGKITASK